MTIEQTRQLGIEFERRVQTMIPEKEYIDKLDTETIYSFLNQYQDKYIHEIYRGLDSIQSGSKLSAHIESILQSLLSSFETAKDSTDTWTYGDSLPAEFTNSSEVITTIRSKTFTLPEDFHMYIRSISKVSSTFTYKATKGADPISNILSNQLVSQSEV